MAITKEKLIELIQSSQLEIGGGLSNPMPDTTLIINLNADMLDNKHASEFFPISGGILAGNFGVNTNYWDLGGKRRVVYYGTGTLANFNDLVDEWALAPTAATNAPAIGGAYCYVNTVFYSNTNFGMQIAYGYTTNGVLARRQNNGAWSAWYKVSP